MSARSNTIEDHQRDDLGLVLRLTEEARRALLAILNRYRVDGEAARIMCTGLAISSPAAIPSDIPQRFGPEAQGVAAATADCISNPLWDGIYTQTQSDDILALLKAPDWYFLRLLEAGFEALIDVHGYDYAGRDLTPVYDQLRTNLNRTLQGAGGVYTIDDDHKAVSVGEDLLDTEVLRPALRALAQPEMRLVDRDLKAALRGLAAGDQAGFETAITQGAGAVEGILAVLVDQHNLRPPGTGTAKYFTVLKEHGVLASHFRSLVMAAGEIRNKEAGHSSQTTPRGATEESARAVVYSACVAITYLSSKLVQH